MDGTYKAYEEHFSKALAAEDPLLGLHVLRFTLLGQGIPYEEVQGIFVQFSKEAPLEEEPVVIAWLGLLSEHVASFLALKERLLEACRPGFSIETILGLVEALSREGKSKRQIYDVLHEFFVYVQHDRTHGDADVEVVAEVLDGLWGGGWAKGGRILPLEPDVSDASE